jgi:hypothetical protein
VAAVEEAAGISRDGRPHGVKESVKADGGAGEARTSSMTAPTSGAFGGGMSFGGGDFGGGGGGGGGDF